MGPRDGSPVQVYYTRLTTISKNTPLLKQQRRLIYVSGNH